MSTCTAPGWVLGCDVALRHAGMVLVDEAGDVVKAWALVTGAGDARALALAGVDVQRVPSGEQSASGDAADLLRLATLRGWLERVIADAVALGAGSAVLEGIAPAGSLASGWRRIVAVSQACGLARLALCDARLPHALVDPRTIGRVLWAGRRLPKGTTKTTAARLVRERWGYEWPGDGEGDLVDAYVLAVQARLTGENA